MRLESEVLTAALQAHFDIIQQNNYMNIQGFDIHGPWGGKEK